ncbi:unnamed protein product [marine sediment metagenome]|uniref:Uncharacterized protein n=1 Tax=marine sediment metagenome TaxID=412755 RepID=X0VHV0_9ZZZZ
MSEEEKTTEDKETIEMGDGCRLIFSKDGNILIKGNCDGKEINRLDVSIFNKVSTIIEDEDEI